MSNIIALLPVLIIALIVVFTLRTDYVTFKPSVRERVLAQHKTKNGQLAYETYSKIYTPKYVLSLSLISISLLMYLASNIIEAVQGHEQATITSAIVGGVGVIMGIAGSTYGYSLLKRK